MILLELILFDNEYDPELFFKGLKDPAEDPCSSSYHEACETNEEPGITFKEINQYDEILAKS